MNFELADEHKMLKELVARFVREQLIPLEPAVLAREAAGQGLVLLPEERQRLDKLSHELGLWGLDAPTEMNGSDLPVVAMVGVNEELGRSITPFELPPDSPNLRMLLKVADASQRARYLEPYARGETVSAIAISESANACSRLRTERRSATCPPARLPSPSPAMKAETMRVTE